MTQCNILLDSGAFSAWVRGEHIDLDAYIDYCKRHGHEVDSYANLDVIPGSDGKMDHSLVAVEKSASQSYENLQVMKAAGLKPIALFHQGERFHWLEKMLEDGEQYIGISPYSRAHQNEIIEWMDKCFTRCCDGQGRPLIKTHGFGVTSNVLCTRYPWFSVDSTSWSIGGGYGSILVPRYTNNKPDFTQPPLTLKMSARKADQFRRGFDGLPESQQDLVRRAAADAGVSMGSLRNTFLGRWEFNVSYYKGMEAACKGNLFKNHTKGMFHKFVQGTGYDPQPLKLYFATVLHTDHHNIFLNKQGIRNRLLSYAFLKDVRDSALTEYIETGLPPDLKPKRPKKASLKSLNSEVYRVKRAQGALARLARQETV